MPLLIVLPLLAGAGGWAVGFFSSDGIKYLLWFAVLAFLLVLALGVI